MTGWYKHYIDNRSTYYVEHHNDKWSIKWFNEGKYRNTTIWTETVMRDYLRKLIPLTKLEQALK